MGVVSAHPTIFEGTFCKNIQHDEILQVTKFSQNSPKIQVVILEDFLPSLGFGLKSRKKVNLENIVGKE